MTQAVSEFDKWVYQEIRANVTRFLARQAAQLDAAGLKVLDVAPQDHAGARQCFVKSQVVTADIDKKSGADYIIDITSDNSGLIPDDTFDVVVCTEVLEHTLEPFRAADEMFRILKAGGFLLVSTPFNFRIHGPLPDCWRFTEHGIRALLAKFGSVAIDALEDKERILMPLHYTTVARK